jgi:hypothetical protein
MRIQIVRRLLATGLALTLASGVAVAKVGKENRKVATKTVVANKSVSSSKEAAARKARLKKIGSAAPKTEPKAAHRKKVAKPDAKSTKKHAHIPAHDELASSTDGGSAAERRARIHSMQVPE